MSEKSALDLLTAGAKIIAPVLEPHGFVFKIETHAKGSGGWFASGSFTRENRSLELHFRQSLGLVTYHIDQSLLNHEAYMRLLGVYGENQYPDFPDEPLESFRHLAADIENHCKDFTTGDGLQFHPLAAMVAKDSMIFKGIP
ncbi:MAG TPA: hypothetical protein VKH81_25370 [Candidatus Angelobacter sp.]|nr:hypothetical protein [Candidatus Angelobacter sp.]